MTIDQAIDQCTIEGTTVKLPAVQLDRKVYMGVNKKLQGIGGKWNRKAQGFVFSEDPAPLLGRVQAGENVNLKKEFQFFATPSTVADTLVGLAELEDGDHVLEPSAGHGAIVQAIIDDLADTEIDAVEIQERNVKVLEEKFDDIANITIIEQDFLQFALECSGSYEKIIANPPFTKNQDIDHVMTMFSLLNDTPGSTLVAIMSTGWIRNSNKKAKEFRRFMAIPEPTNDQEKWARNLAQNGGGKFETNTMDEHGTRSIYIETLDPGTFKESGTNVATAIVVIKRL